MKIKLLVLFVFLSLFGIGQISPSSQVRVTNDVTTFGTLVPQGTNVFDVNTKKIYYSLTTVETTDNLLTAITKFRQFGLISTSDLPNSVVLEAAGGEVVLTAGQYLGLSQAGNEITIALDTNKAVLFNDTLSNGKIASKYNLNSYVLKTFLESGTATGQLPVWDGSKYAHSTHLTWDETNNVLGISGMFRIKPFTYAIPTTGEGLEMTYDQSLNGLGIIKSYDRDSSLYKKLWISATSTEVVYGNLGIGTTANGMAIDAPLTVYGNTHFGGHIYTWPGDDGTNSQVLTTNGSGILSWTDKGGGSSSGITSLNSQTGATQSFANGTNVTMTSTGNTHTLGWTGQLGVSGGGTGASTLTGLVLGNGTSAFTTIANNSSHWDDGYAYRLTSASGTSPLTITLASNGLTGSVAAFSGSSAGVVPTSTGGTTKYLRADGAWETPVGTNYFQRNTTTLSPATANDLLSVTTNQASVAAITATSNGANVGTNYGLQAAVTNGATNIGLYTNAYNGVNGYAIYASASGNSINYSFYGANGTMYNKHGVLFPGAGQSGSYDSIYVKETSTGLLKTASKILSQHWQRNSTTLSPTIANDNMSVSTATHDNYGYSTAIQGESTSDGTWSTGVRGTATGAGYNIGVSAYAAGSAIDYAVYASTEGSTAALQYSFYGSWGQFFSTDSISTFGGVSHCNTVRDFNTNIAYPFFSDAYGFGKVIDPTGAVYASFRFDYVGQVTLLSDNTSNVANTDTNGFFCVYDGGDHIILKNRLVGGIKDAIIEITYRIH